MAGRHFFCKKEEMRMQQVQIPSGLRDTYGTAAVKKRTMIREIEDIFQSCGYEPIMTPTIEFFQTYLTGYARPQDEEFYKFFDQNGQILTLRADMTVPIARFAATKMGDRKPPYRFFYSANVYKVNQSFDGKRNEVTDCGVELIGEDAGNDLEILKLASDVMEKIGGDRYTLEIGNSAVFRLACSEAGLSSEEMEELAVLTDRKSMVDLQQFTESHVIPCQARDFLNRLPLLSGDRNVLDEAASFCFHPMLGKEILRLRALSDDLNELGCRNISFDLGKIPYLNYYTGIIFQGYVGGVGNSVLSGGRYDDLLARFGKKHAACGFGVKVDYLCSDTHEKTGGIRTLVYPRGRIVEALHMAEKLRRDGPLALREGDVEEMEVQE